MPESESLFWRINFGQSTSTLRIGGQQIAKSGFGRNCGLMYSKCVCRFGGPDFSFDRMSWIKTNFLWMMYRCGWAEKKDQERVLAVRITKEGFMTILANAYTAEVRQSIKTLSPSCWQFERMATPEILFCAHHALVSCNCSVKRTNASKTSKFVCSGILTIHQRTPSWTEEQSSWA